ncbi:MAG: cob(I)yrinic acid a,c-diamide adenosyltransferase [Nanoarchaeota archaeon]|nr:cob(I)yrinic acid a,c-diamide adenosyltransferase [Nanoarchaeota archaeon]
MLYVFTGNGKGKTTAAIGTAIRALGYGKKVIIIQFMKKRDSGEKRFFKKHNYEFYQFGTKKFVNLKKPSKKDEEEAKKALEFAKKKIKEKPFLMVLDELNVAIAAKLLDLKDVLTFLKQAKGVNIIITGRYAKKEIIEIADLVTQMKEIKHPFKKGKLAKKGLDY